MPVVLTVCQTNPLSGQCVNPTIPASSVTVQMNALQTSTFAVFARGLGNILFNPGINRAFLRFWTLAGGIVGATSVAVRVRGRCYPLPWPWRWRVTLAGCARMANTPRQEMAWRAWQQRCAARFPSVKVERVVRRREYVVFGTVSRCRAGGDLTGFRFRRILRAGRG